MHKGSGFIFYTSNYDDDVGSADDDMMDDAFPKHTSQDDDKG